MTWSQLFRGLIAVSVLMLPWLRAGGIEATGDGPLWARDGDHTVLRVFLAPSRRKHMIVGGYQNSFQGHSHAECNRDTRDAKVE